MDHDVFDELIQSTREGVDAVLAARTPTAIKQALDAIAPGAEWDYGVDCAYLSEANGWEWDVPTVAPTQARATTMDLDCLHGGTMSVVNPAIVDLPHVADALRAAAEAFEGVMSDHYQQTTQGDGQ